MSLSDARGDVDHTFALFSEQKRELAVMMNADFQYYHDKLVLPEDRGCQYQMGVNDELTLAQRIGLEDAPIHLDLSNYYKCLNCHLLSKLGIVDRAFTIEHGSKYGLKFVIEDCCRHMRFLRKFDQPKLLVAKLVKDGVYSRCEPGINRLIGAEFYGGDKFTIASLVYIYLEMVFQHYGIEPLLWQVPAIFICANKGYRIREQTMKSLSEIVSPIYVSKGIFREPVVHGLLYQLSLFFHVLKDYQFSYHNPTLDNVSFHQQQVRYAFDGTSYSSPISLKFNITGDCAITIPDAKGNNTRLYHYEGESRTPFRHRVEEMVFSFINCVDTDTTGACKINKSYVYRYDSKDQYCDFVYSSSVGLYSFLCLLMTDPIFYRSLKQYPKLDEFWKSFFLRKDLLTLETRLCSDRHYDIDELLKGIYLRCDADKHSWDLIKILNERH